MAQRERRPDGIDIVQVPFKRLQAVSGLRMHLQAAWNSLSASSWESLPSWKAWEVRLSRRQLAR